MLWVGLWSVILWHFLVHNHLFFHYQQAPGGAESTQEVTTQDVTFTFDNGKLTGSNGVANKTVDA